MGKAERNPTFGSLLPNWAIWVGVLMLTLAAFGLRIAYFQNTSMLNPIRADAIQYLNYASNLVNHGVYSMAAPATEKPQPDSFRSPGYPVLLAGVLVAVNEQSAFQAILVMQALMSAALVFVAFRIGIRFLPVGGCFLAALLVAISPHLISSSSYILTETSYALALSLSVLSIVRFVERPDLVRAILSGILLGIAYLINEVTLLLPLFLIVVTALICRRDKSPGRMPAAQGSWKISLLALLMVFSLFPACWSIRNRLAVESEALTGKQRALNTITHGSYPGFVYKDPRLKYYPYRDDPEQPEYAESVSNFVRIFSRRFMERPIRHLSWYFLEKPYYLWSWNILQGQGDIYIYPVSSSLYSKSDLAELTRTIMQWIHPALVGLALLGSVLVIYSGRRLGCFEDPSRPTLLFAVLWYFTLLYSVFFPLPRYSIALRPLLYVVAVWSAWKLLSLLRRSEARI